MEVQSVFLCESANYGGVCYWECPLREVQLYTECKIVWKFKMYEYIYIQWNPSNPDTLGTRNSVLMSGVVVCASIDLRPYAVLCMSLFHGVHSEGTLY